MSERSGQSSAVGKTSVVRSVSDVLVPLLVLALVLLVWQGAVWWWRISPVLLPGPGAVLTACWKIRASLLESAFRTALAALTGLSISIVLGTLTAFAFSQSALVRRAFYPYAVLLQTVPIIAIAPIVIVSLGRGFVSVATVSAILSLFPIITSTTTGLLQVDTTLLSLRVPAALPYLISGIRIASGSSIVGAIVGEFFVGDGTPGLGSLIQRKSASLVLSELYATVGVATVLGTLVFGLITVVGERVLRRRFGMSLGGRISGPQSGG
jgi:NitT/TauT family transport system permease protein